MLVDVVGSLSLAVLRLVNGDFVEVELVNGGRLARAAPLLAHRRSSGRRYVNPHERPPRGANKQIGRSLSREQASIEHTVKIAE